MKYEVVISLGNEINDYIEVENVTEVYFSEDMVFFNDEKGERLLIVPKAKLVYAKIVTE